MKKIIQFFKNFSALRKNRRNKKAMGSTFIIKDETSVLDVDLLDKQATDENKKKIRQYSKKIVGAILIVAILWITWNYVLATYALITYQSSEPLVELSREVCRTVIATCIAYFAKALLETFSEKTVTPYLLNNETAEDGIQIDSSVEEEIYG